MFFITANKNDLECKRIVHDFPCVTVLEISEADLFNMIDTKEDVYIDCRLQSNYTALFLHELKGIKFLERKGGRYFIY